MVHLALRKRSRLGGNAAEKGQCWPPGLLHLGGLRSASLHSVSLSHVAIARGGFGVGEVYRKLRFGERRS